MIGQLRSPIIENRLSVLEPIIKSDASEGVTGPDETSLWSHDEVELYLFLCFKLHLKSLITRSSEIAHAYTMSTTAKIKSPMLHNPQ